jgi:2',3'-cyclic-nucleotide 2'-phosphodiesterase (5'-nucleotidase family)
MPRLRIVSVNDVYSLENLPRLATLLQERRETRREEKPADAFLVVLAGDFLAPSMLSSLDFGAGMVDCLNAVGVTHVIFGNHEDDVPRAELEKRISEFRGVWLDSNAHAFGDRLPRTQVIEVGAVRVGLLGVVMSDPSTYRDVPFGSRGVEPANEVARREAAVLRASCSTVIPLTHQPMDDDRELARTSPPFPLIIGGHEHVPFLEQVGTTWIVKAGADATRAAVIDLVWPDDVRSSGEPVVTIELEPVASFVEDPQVRARVDHHMVRVRELETSTLFTLPAGTSLSSVGTRRQQTSLGTLVCSTLRDTMRAEVGLLNGGGLRGSREYRAHFTYGDLETELPFDNELVVVRLPGQVLAEAVAASRAHAPADSGAFLQVDDGVDLDPATHRIHRVAGAPLDPSRDYAVATVRNLFDGLDRIEPLVRFGREHRGRLPQPGSGRDAKHVLVEAFALDLFRALPAFEVVDTDHDGRISVAEVEAALGRQSHQAPSHLVAELVMNAVDADHDRFVTREEATAAQQAPRRKA